MPSVESEHLKIVIFATVDLSQMGNCLVQTISPPRAGTHSFSSVSAGQVKGSGNALGELKPHFELVKSQFNPRCSFLK